MELEKQVPQESTEDILDEAQCGYLSTDSGDVILNVNNTFLALIPGPRQKSVIDVENYVAGIGRQVSALRFVEYVLCALLRYLLFKFHQTDRLRRSRFEERPDCCNGPL